jgi:sterol desaturase/sphingolipid hydroxylase (fatty acid hydroxylase superfamily)
MDNWLVKYEWWLRIAFFLTGLTLLGSWEKVRGWRNSAEQWTRRYLKHLSLLSGGAVIGRLLFPVWPVVVAMQVQSAELGLLFIPELRGSPGWLKVLLSLLLLDLIMYALHRFFHLTRIGWWLHKMHHTDKHLDASTGLRLHPLEYLVVLAIKLLAVVFIGAPVLAVLIYEILYNLSSMFIHANIQLGTRLEKVLRWAIVTPGLHRIHHSEIEMERQKNFGMLFCWWDKLLNTYHPQALRGEQQLVLGLAEYWAAKYQNWWQMLSLPFQRRAKQGLGAPKKSRSSPNKRKGA